MENIKLIFKNKYLTIEIINNKKNKNPQPLRNPSEQVVPPFVPYLFPSLVLLFKNMGDVKYKSKNLI